METSLAHRAAVVEKIPADKLSTLAYWEKLDSDQRAELSQTVQALSSELVGQWKSVLRAGELVNHLYEQTNPYGAFLRTLRALWGNYFSASSAYRYRNVYLAVQSTLSKEVIDVAVASGISLVSADPDRPFGQYTDLVKKLPAPTPGVRGAKEWVENFTIAKEKMEKAGPIAVPSPTDADARELTKECYLLVRSRFKRLPNNHKTRARFVQDLVGYLMREAGMASTQTFGPATPPNGWAEIRRGRPRTKAA
jgi:hypothetical protein